MDAHFSIRYYHRNDFLFDVLILCYENESVWNLEV